MQLSGYLAHQFAEPSLDGRVDILVSFVEPEGPLARLGRDLLQTPDEDVDLFPIQQPGIPEHGDMCERTYDVVEQ